MFACDVFFLPCFADSQGLTCANFLGHVFMTIGKLQNPVILLKKSFNPVGMANVPVCAGCDIYIYMYIGCL